LIRFTSPGSSIRGNSLFSTIGDGGASKPFYSKAAGWLGSATLKWKLACWRDTILPERLFHCVSIIKSCCFIHVIIDYHHDFWVPWNHYFAGAFATLLYFLIVESC
jgi:hypothetical protein